MDVLMEIIKQVALWIVPVSGAITSLLVFYKKYRDKHPKKISLILCELKKLNCKVLEIAEIQEEEIKNNEAWNAALTRFQLENANTIYNKRLGWCPVTDRSALFDLYDLYVSKKHNHVAKNYKEKIEQLPEDESELKEKIAQGLR